MKIRQITTEQLRLRRASSWAGAEETAGDTAPKRHPLVLWRADEEDIAELLVTRNSQFRASVRSPAQQSRGKRGSPGRRAATGRPSGRRRRAG